ncbi:MAG: hypothetical protein RL660_2129 [Bacteroidota bacterium]
MVALTFLATNLKGQTPINVGWNFTGSTTEPAPSNIGTPVGFTVGALGTGGNFTASANTAINTTSASSGYTITLGSVAASGTNNHAFCVANSASTPSNASFNSTTSPYFEFSITADPGMISTVNSIGFGSRSTGTGPQVLDLRSSADGYASTIGNGGATITSLNTSVWTARSIPNINVSTPSGGSVTYRLYLYGGTGTAINAGSAANFRLDDLIVQVTTAAAVCTPPTLSLAPLDPSCATATDGSITVTSTGGTGPFTYSWNSGQSTQSISGVGVGTYTVTASTTSNGGCSTTASATLSNTATCMAFTTPIVNAGCYNQANKSIEIDATGGAGTYTFTAMPSATYDNTLFAFLNLGAATYTITATDGTQTITTTVAVSEPAELVGGYVGTGPVCNGGNDASISANATGGTVSSLYVFDWYATPTSSTILFSGDTPPAATVAAIGNYMLVVTDDMGCTDTVLNMTITEPAAIVSNTTLVACDSAIIPWLSSPVTTGGLYTNLFIGGASNGCDSTSNINVTLNYAVSTSSSASGCNAYLLPWGTTVTTSGTYSNTYTNASSSGCDSTSEIIVTINTSYDDTIAASGSLVYTLPWGTTVSTGGYYTNTYTSAAGCDSTVTFNVTITGIRLAARVLLSGPLAVSGAMPLMNDDLRAQNVIPAIEPYGSMNIPINPYTPVFTHVGGGGGEAVGSAVLSATGNDAIVDWVFIQLRSASNNAMVVATRSALVQRDGDVVEVDGISPVEFPSLATGAYFVSIKHRNHLAVLTANAVALTATASTVDFTSSATATFARSAPQHNPSPLTGAQRTIGTVRCLYAGNCNIADASRNRIVTYNSSTASDRAALLAAAPGTTIINGYTVFDCNMNGNAQFNGLQPDRLIILANVANSNTIIAYEQLP